jgi:NADH-quinone oxidoreductase subunit N
MMDTINKLMLPEILIASLASLILLWDVFVFRKVRITSYWLTQLGLLFVIASICNNFKYLAQNIYLFNNSLILNYQINFFKLIIVGFMLVILFYAKAYIKHKNCFCGEYFVLSLLSVFGMMILIGGSHFLNFYLGLEMFSLPIYGIMTLESKQANLEATVKYFVISAVFSGVLLYGLSLIYGATGTLSFQEINNFINTQHLTVLFNIGVLLVFVSILFKLNLVPFHMWAPDVYEGAPTPVVMLIATLPKIITVMIFGRIINEVFPGLINKYWQYLLIFIAILSLIIGNIGAIFQTNIKRLLAYSAIAHAGFILLGFIANTEAGRAAANFYAVSYALMFIGMFGFIILFSKNNFELEDIKNFSGINVAHPWLSGILLILLLSLFGIPPTLGFYAKFLIIKSLINVNLISLSVAALIFSLIGLFYYLRIIKNMFFINDNSNNLNIKLSNSCVLVLVLSVNGLLALGLGLFPGFINNILKYF